MDPQRISAFRSGKARLPGLTRPGNCRLSIPGSRFPIAEQLMTRRGAAFYLAIIGSLFAISIGWYGVSFLDPERDSAFDGNRALADVEEQLAFGPRTPGSEGHARMRSWMRTRLESLGWTVKIQESQQLGHPIFNLIALRSDEPPQLIVGAHYDTRIFADHDPEPERRGEPVPGANDGASGVAVLLELARVLPADAVPIWLVFFDAEDNGRIEGWDWILGSRAFVQALDHRPQAIVIIDMIGDADLDIYFEKNSDPSLRSSIWATAAELGHGGAFIPQEKYGMLDDHTPFLEAGIPAVVIIDFDYPFWHTTGDTTDKVSAASLGAVGETLLAWILPQEP